EVNDKLDGEIETITTMLLNRPVLHVDESPVRCTSKPDYSVKAERKCAKATELARARIAEYNAYKAEVGIQMVIITSYRKSQSKQDNESKSKGIFHPKQGKERLPDLWRAFYCDRIKTAQGHRN
ncbi:MAG: hypothetical protein FWD79_12555, partial [Desulfobulbus sp.]|nr:hypothetical protein [Desulfobulbus sp.]